MKTSKIKFLPAILAASVLTLTSCEKDELLENPSSSAEATQTESSANSGNRYIVTFKDGANLDDSRIASAMGNNRLANKRFAKLQGKAFTGITMELSADELEELRNNKNIERIEADEIFALGKGGT